MKKHLAVALICLTLAACAHPSYPDKCSDKWFYHDGPIGYWNAYTLPNTRDGLKTGADIGGLYGLLPIVDIVTEPVGAIVGGAIGLVGDALNMTLGALSVVTINPLTCDSGESAAE